MVLVRGYQLGSATADWVMWIVLADQRFSTTLDRVLVIISIVCRARERASRG